MHTVLPSHTPTMEVDMMESPKGRKNGKWIAGRLFFQDLLSLVTHDSLTETGKKWYCDMARMLLASIWDRLGNRIDNFNTSGKPVLTEVFSFAYVFKEFETPYLNMGSHDRSNATSGAVLPPSHKDWCLLTFIASGVVRSRSPST